MPARKILIIEDDKLIRLTTSLLLRQEGITAIGARNGMEGLEMARREKPAAILLDIQMPDIDGWEVLKRLKAMPEASAIPILIITADEEGASLKEARNRGAAGILRKPFTVEKVLRFLDKQSSPPGD